MEEVGIKEERVKPLFEPGQSREIFTITVGRSCGQTHTR